MFSDSQAHAPEKLSNEFLPGTNLGAKTEFRSVSPQINFIKNLKNSGKKNSHFALKRLDCSFGVIKTSENDIRGLNTFQIHGGFSKNQWWARDLEFPLTTGHFWTKMFLKGKFWKNFNFLTLDWRWSIRVNAPTRDLKIYWSLEQKSQQMIKKRYF